MKENMKTMSPPKKPEGVDKFYLSIKDEKAKQFERDLEKKEGGVIPECNGTVVYKDKKQKLAEKNPYDN